jgi:hypothetical protein
MDEIQGAGDACPRDQLAGIRLTLVGDAAERKSARGECRERLGDAGIQPAPVKQPVAIAAIEARERAP